MYKKEVNKQHQLYYKQFNKKIKGLKLPNLKEYCAIIAGKTKDNMHYARKNPNMKKAKSYLTNDCTATKALFQFDTSGKNDR